MVILDGKKLSKKIKLELKHEVDLIKLKDKRAPHLVAILIGQISAALASGNNVMIKPSEHTSILGYLVTKRFHEAGVPVNTLELILGDGIYGEMLTKINPLHGVAFTGSLPTAKKIQSKFSI